MTNQWQDLYPELVNKLRWAIHSTMTQESTVGSKLVYQDCQRIATVLSQEVIDLVKLWSEQPMVLGSTSTIRGFFDQVRVDSKMNKD